MKPWKIFIVIVVNVFLMMSANVISELMSLSQRFEILADTISSSVETALTASTASEELFSDYAMDHYMTSFGYSLSDTSSDPDSMILTKAAIPVFPNGSAPYQAGIYGLYAKYGNDYKNVNYAGTPSSVATPSREEVFETLFGGLGTTYLKPTYSYVNTNRSVIQTFYSPTYRKYVNKDRSATEEFDLFYSRIGRYMPGKYYVKELDPTTYSYSIKEYTLPILSQMGLTYKYTGIDDISDENGHKVWESATESAKFTSDNLCQSVHIGKSANGGINSVYYFTPYSLGVTYVPIGVFKSTVLSVLDTRIKLRKLSGYTQGVTGAPDLKSAVQSATGCMESLNGNLHTASNGILNDGYVEYDLSSLKVKVDYFKVDFSTASSCKKTITKCVGIMPSDSSGAPSSASLSDLIDKTVERLNETDSGKKYGVDEDNYRLVARVSVKLKVHIPYESIIMQYRKLAMGVRRADEHGGFGLYDTSNPNLSHTSDGVWYTYTTYYANTR